jgi:undecaprenyl-diphosphatase
MASTWPAGHSCSAVNTGFVALGPLKVAFLGVVQGISELLPISSTAHMRAIPALLGWPDPGSAFSAAMQLAALLAVVSYFRADLSHVARGSARAVRSRHWGDADFRLLAAVLVATVPIVIAGALLSKTLNACNSPLRTPMVIGIACVAMALLLAMTELLARHRRRAEQLTLWDAVWIGIAQVGALIPGVSRSGSTLTASLALGFARADAARVAFLLGIPAIALAGVHELWLLAKTGLPPGAWVTLGIGLLVSSLSSFFAIWVLMRFLEQYSTWPLIAYRAAFGLLLIVGAAVGLF